MADIIDHYDPCRRGHIGPWYRFPSGQSRCVACVREDNTRNINKKLNNATYLRKRYALKREECAAKRRKWSSDNPERTMLSAARRFSRARGLPFNLTVEDIIIPAVCPVLGIPLSRRGGKRTDNTPSLDRIVPSKGYVKGNVMVISWRANALKRDASPEELRKLAAFYAGLD